MIICTLLLQASSTINVLWFLTVTGATTAWLFLVNVVERSSWGSPCVECKFCFPKGRTSPHIWRCTPWKIIADTPTKIYIHIYIASDTKKGSKHDRWLWYQNKNYNKLYRAMHKALIDCAVSLITDIFPPAPALLLSLLHTHLFSLCHKFIWPIHNNNKILSHLTMMMMIDI